MKHIIITLFILIKTIISISFDLIEGRYITAQVGQSILTLAIDPTSNINFIFDSSFCKFSNYNATASDSLRKSKAILKLSYLFGEFKGNLANDLFIFTYTHDTNSIEEKEFRMDFILVKEAQNLAISKVDGILGLGYKPGQSLFYNQMSLLMFLTNQNIIRSKSIHLNYKKSILSFDKNDFDISNQTIIHMSINTNDTIPIMYYDKPKFGFAPSKTSRILIEKKLKINVSLIVDTYEDVIEEDNNSTQRIQPSFIIAPKSSKKEVYDYYLSKFQQTQKEDQIIEQNQLKYIYFTYNKFDNLNLETRSALIFGKFYFLYKWIDNSNLNQIKFPVALRNSTLFYNINLKAFNPEIVSYDYDNLEVRISNCEFCGVTKKEPTFVYMILISVIVIIGGILLCVAFTKFVRYRKDKASQMLKQYNLI